MSSKVAGVAPRGRASFFVFLMGANPMNIVRFVKYKSWLIIADEESYKTSVSIGVPLLKIHEDMIPSLKLIFKEHGLKGKKEDFLETIWAPFFETFKNTWHVPERGRVLKYEKFGRMQLVCKMKSEALLNKALDTLNLFLQRWSFLAETEVKKRGVSISVNVSFAFSERVQPLLRLDELQLPSKDSVEPQIFEFGNLRFVFEERKGFGKAPDYVVLKTESKAGDNWDCVHSANLRDWELNPTQVNGLIKYLFQLKVQNK